MTDNRRVDLYVQGLFQNGLEGYDSTQRSTPSKGATNVGGAKMFFHQNFRTNESPILINHKGLEKAIADAPVIVYALNRVELDEEGNPARVNGGYKRIYTGLMLYVEYENDGTLTKSIRDRLIESVKEVNLSNYIEVGDRINDPEGLLKAVESQKHQNFARELVPLKIHNCIFLALPSGAPGSTQFWSFRNIKASSRANMSRSVTASDVESEGLPF